MSDGGHILLIEDNRSDAHVIQELIADTGLDSRVTWLCNGEKAINYFDDGNTAGLIILDLNLPRVNGHAVMAYLNENGKDIPVLVMTGSSSPRDIERAQAAGAVCYIIKPMTIGEMDETTAVLKKMIVRHGSRR